MNEQGSHSLHYLRSSEKLDPVRVTGTENVEKASSDNLERTSCNGKGESLEGCVSVER